MFYHQRIHACALFAFIVRVTRYSNDDTFEKMFNVNQTQTHFCQVLDVFMIVAKSLIWAFASLTDKSPYDNSHNKKLQSDHVTCRKPTNDRACRAPRRLVKLFCCFIVQLSVSSRSFDSLRAPDTLYNSSASAQTSNNRQHQPDERQVRTPELERFTAWISLTCEIWACKGLCKRLPK